MAPGVIGTCNQQAEVPVTTNSDHTGEMKIRLTEEKAVQITTACKRAREKGFLSTRELARLIGKISATLPAVFPAPLW